jgi:tRNA dimethylallyltransferase
VLTELAPLVVIVGATGTGKSDLALSLAVHFRGEVVNCDSLQIYRYLDIGTAKVPPAERRGIPHHLIDIANPDEVFTAGDYMKMARSVLREITSRRNVPIVVGGTGFYLRALLHGLFEGPSRNEGIRQRLAQKSSSLHRILKRLDPAAAARIHANDTNKLMRAIEVCLVSSNSLTAMHRQGSTPLDGYSVLKVGLSTPRAELNERLNLRCSEMFAHGLVEEIRGILAMGFPTSAKAFEAIGYRQAVELIEGKIAVEQAIAAAQLSTRQYAKRQETWFRRESDVHWISTAGNRTETTETAKGLVETFVKSFVKNT